MTMLYIDPGTGSMLFTILLGILGAGVYSLRDALVKFRFYISGGKAEKADADTPDYVIFADHKRYWNVFEPICDEFERRGLELVYMTASPDDPALSKPYKHVRCEFIGEGNKAYAKLNMLRADILLSTTPSLDVFYWKRSKNVKYYVHIPHAADDIVKYRMFGIDYYDAILTTADYHERQIRTLEEKRGLPPKEIVKVGLTYMDTMKERLENAEPLPAPADGRQTVLLAPSWGPSAIFSKYGGKVIEALLKTDYRIVIRPHPQSYTSEKEMLDSLMKQFPESDRLEWNKDNDNFDVLRRADILISDFSGIIFDFSLVFDKPVIYTDVQFDASPYDACWLDEELWTFRVLPQLGQQLTDENMPEIGKLVDECLNDPRFAQGRKAAREEGWSYIGESTVRTVDYLTAKHAELEEAARVKAEQDKAAREKETKKKKSKKEAKKEHTEEKAS